MGYGISTNAIFGVQLDPSQSKKLHQALLATAQADDYDGGHLCLYSLLGRISKKSACHIDLIAEDSDSRIHNTTYEDGFEHTFGVLVARKGYGARSTSQEFSAKMNEDLSAHKQAFNTVAAPILAAAGLGHLEPSLVIGSYTA